MTLREVKTNRRVIVLLAIVLTCVGCDQATKTLATRHLAGGDTLSFLGGTVRLEYAENTGSFLGLGSSLPEAVRFWIFTVLVGVGLLALLVYLIRARSLTRGQGVLLGLILAGGLGNLLDRVALGFVRDFMIVGVGDLKTGVFNVADFAITTGALLLLLQMRGDKP
ncbi:MAG: signal peptidase II [Acidobacteriota bacterium]|nr:signal peptidase II [Acidobacteriota bacterium]